MDAHIGLAAHAIAMNSSQEPDLISGELETAVLLSIPGMRESILEGMATNLSELSREPGWDLDGSDRLV
jgi:hypothetical protein